ncbi:transmembrane protein 221 [Alosa sapidissima]|uniref:transmembrane protein 221 n=1 Tax=Alosa sapidissima TaxID=34773 RepID=UPI001C08BE86|nr:transmembrane protein 221 [Alosa sapidissima]
MTYTYSQRSLMVLALLGVLSAIMSLLSVFLIFQLQSQQTGVKESTSPIVPVEVAVVLLPVSTVLTALSLTLNLSSVVVCILHSYFTAEICRGEEDTERADWFLFDSRAVRHVAIGLFCLGVSVYLAAMSIYMLLVFENETGIASVCVLSSGVLVLLIIVAHSLARAARTARQYHSEHPHAMYQNEPESSPGVYPPELGHVDKVRTQRSQSILQRQLSYPPCPNVKQKQQYASSSGMPSHTSEKESYSGSGGAAPRMHRTLSAESGLLQSPSKPWNGINSEMRTVLARKSGAISKDSTLV